MSGSLLDCGVFQVYKASRQDLRVAKSCLIVLFPNREAYGESQNTCVPLPWRCQVKSAVPAAGPSCERGNVRSASCHPPIACCHRCDVTDRPALQSAGRDGMEVELLAVLPNALELFTR
ncbi:unnamed protein product [Acanthoscelides obtectus]|uniref:Uncharacterized protein n=1 Tax=Acanthoscelides obtectus TaxID=200917 RepID=A0A9P0KL02_ACAOB|nr:unnamed protein product [Acanthoscelides obtectus]CAK1671641.1 hypothetical protein AOBTE_LOCUS28380 [Acanthoscelides obtectus]